MNNLSVHHHNGCILFLNADIDNRAEAGQITRCTKLFVHKFGMKTKDEVIGQNMKTFVMRLISEKHQFFIDEFIRNKKRFNNMIPLSFAFSIDQYIIPIAAIVKLST